MIYILREPTVPLRSLPAGEPRFPLRPPHFGPTKRGVILPEGVSFAECIGSLKKEGV
jgi:hypothetical protein